MRLVRYLPVAAVAFGIIIGGSASQANADIPGGNGCSGTGDWLEDGLRVQAETNGGVYTIPRTDTVHWVGSVAGPPGVYSGSVSVDLPPPFGEMLVDDWGGDSETTGNEGNHEYDLPWLVPNGVEFEVFGQHSDENGDCSGTIRFKIAGAPFDSAAIFVGLGGTLASAAAAAMLMRPLFRKVI